MEQTTRPITCLMPTEENQLEDLSKVRNTPKIQPYTLNAANHPRDYHQYVTLPMKLADRNWEELKNRIRLLRKKHKEPR